MIRTFLKLPQRLDMISREMESYADTLPSIVAAIVASFSESGSISKQRPALAPICNITNIFNHSLEIKSSIPSISIGD